MPRELTDLMESAVAAAPPEKYLAGDITRAAERHQRRRTTFVAAAAALAVIVTGAVGYGATRHQESTPEPIGPWKYGQHHTLSDAVVPDTFPGLVQDLHSGVRAGPVGSRAPARRRAQGRLAAMAV